MKQIIQVIAVTVTVTATCLIMGCGGKSEQADAKSGAPPEQTKVEGERNSAGQAQHYQEMQQKKQNSGQ